MSLNRHLACDQIVIIRYELNEMANYKPDLSSQNKFIPIDFSQQITPGTFEYVRINRTAIVRSAINKTAIIVLSAKPMLLTYPRLKARRLFCEFSRAISMDAN
jgi:hypothetical protein